MRESTPLDALFSYFLLS